MLGAGLMVFSVAACGDDDDSGGDDDTTETTAGDDSGDSGDSESGSSEVQEYCDAVADFVAAAQDDPTNPDLATQAQDLAQQAQDLATGLTAEEAQEVADCSAEAASALTGG
jgi:hypothetical protein